MTILLGTVHKRRPQSGEGTKGCPVWVMGILRKRRFFRTLWCRKL